MPIAPSIDQEEIARFSSHARAWWDPKGVMASLHKLNPARVAYLRAKIATHFGTEGKALPLKGLSVLDIGCGGGLVAEPLARLGGQVTGLDASEAMIAVAKEHAAQEGLKIAYRVGSAEECARSGQAFDIVTLMDILEHAADVGALVRSAAALLKPDGLMLFSTVNRTMKSYLLGIVAAEYVLRWAPVGTHDWNRFVRPSELAAQLAQAGLHLTNIEGIVYDPRRDSFDVQAAKTDVNYMAAAVRD